MKPNLFIYVDARAYIADYIDHLKQLGEYSTRKFARKLELGSPDYLRRVIGGERTISEALAKKICTGFELTELEGAFFKRLVHFTQAKNDSEKKNFWEQLNEVREKAKLRTFSFENYRFYHNWKIGVLMEGLRTQWKNASAATIAEDLGVDLREVADHLQALKELKILEGSDGNWSLMDPVVQSNREAESQLIRGYHRIMMQKAAQTLDELPTDKRKLFALTMALPKDKFEEASQELFGFLESLNLKYGHFPNADGVYNICLQFFPVHDFKK